MPGLPVSETATSQSLVTQLAPLGAELLVQGIEQRLFIEPIDPIKHDEKIISSLTDGYGLAKAPKIRKDDSRIDWSANPTNGEILLRHRVYQRLSDSTTYSRVMNDRLNKNIVFGEWSKYENNSAAEILDESARPQVHLLDGEAHIVSPPTPEDIAAGLGPITAPFTLDGGQRLKGARNLGRCINRARRAAEKLS